MVHVDCKQILSECALDYDRADFLSLSEAAQIQVTDEVLTGMLKFITDKYNSLDFSEIEKSAGNYRKFKYAAMLRENTTTLSNIYSSSSDPGAKKYLEVCQAIDQVQNHLERRANVYETLYKAGNGIIQLLYTSLVAGCIYSLGTLVSNTIRFVTVEQDTDCQVLYDEIPGTIKHVHIKNILAAAKDIKLYEELLDQYSSPNGGKVLKEEVGLAGVVAAAFGVGVVIMLIPKILVLIREVIYSIYYNRVKTAEMLQVQIDLINTNIESLEAGRGTKKVIARQKKIVDKLEKWKNRIAVKMDSTNTLVAMQKKKENAVLKVDRDSPLMREPGSFTPGDLML